MNITRFFFEGDAWNTDTYLRGIVSFERAVNLARESAVMFRIFLDKSTFF